MLLKKHEIEAALHAEHQAISEGNLKEDSPLDTSEEFRIFCEACRRGDLRICQESIQQGVDINARDRFDYTPLILASLCGHFEVVQLLLESGALCERDTFQGERCLYNALNDRIRNLLLSYDYSKSRDPLQPFAGHITSLLSREHPQTSDIILTTASRTFRLHKFLLSARSPYFAKKLASAPETSTWTIPPSIPSRALDIAIVGLYFGEINADFSGGEEDQAILAGVEKLGRILETSHLFDTLIESDRRLARQQRAEEVSRGQKQVESWFQKHVLPNTTIVDSSKVDGIRWDRQNSLFADVLLCAEEEEEEKEEDAEALDQDPRQSQSDTVKLSETRIPIGPISASRSSSSSGPQGLRKAHLFPAHRAMLLRSEYFTAMFSSPFREAQQSTNLPIIRTDCSPEVLQVILTFLYTEEAHFSLDLAIDVLFAADRLFIEKLKVKAAMIISTLGNGTASIVESTNPRGETDDEDAVNIYDVIRAGWVTRVPRLEEFGARYIACRLERYIDKEEFKELVQESAARIQKRQETDTVELIDDIRYYLSERFRLRFEDAGLDEMEEQQQQNLDSITNHNGSVTDTTKELSEGTLVASTAEDPSEKMFGPINEAGVIRTLDGHEAGDEFAQDALNYQILLGKIDTLLESLRLDA